MKQTPTNCGKFEDEPGMRGHCKNCGGTYHEHFSGKVAVQGLTDKRTDPVEKETTGGGTDAFGNLNDLSGCVFVFGEHRSNLTIRANDGGKIGLQYVDKIRALTADRAQSPEVIAAAPVLKAERDELLNHEKQTHDELGAILGTDDDLRECAKRMRDALAQLLKWIDCGCDPSTKSLAAARAVLADQPADYDADFRMKGGVS